MYIDVEDVVLMVAVIVKKLLIGFLKYQLYCHFIWHIWVLRISRSNFICVRPVAPSRNSQKSVLQLF